MKSYDILSSICYRYFSHTCLIIALVKQGRMLSTDRIDVIVEYLVVKRRMYVRNLY